MDQTNDYSHWRFISKRDKWYDLGWLPLKQTTDLDGCTPPKPFKCWDRGWSMTQATVPQVGLSKKQDEKCYLG